MCTKCISKSSSKPQGKAGGRNALIKTSTGRERQQQQLTTFPECVRLQTEFLLLALRVNAIETLSGGVGRTIKVRNP